MRYKTILAAVVLAVMCGQMAFGANPSRIGTAGATELLIPVGSRGTSMGGAVVANSSGIESVYWNPAGLIDINGAEAMFSHLSYIADIAVNFGGVGIPLGDAGALGVTAKILSAGEIEETTDAQPYGTGRTFEPSFSVLGLSYARQLTNRISFGVTLNYIHEDVFEVAADGIGVDAGFMYESDWRGLKLGFAIKNYGPEMNFSGRGFERYADGRPSSPEGASFDLPSSINFGAAYRVFQENESRVEVSGNFRSNNYSDNYFQGGAEYAFQERYFLRAGYNFADQDQWLYGASLGGGATVPIGSIDLSFEYTWSQTEVFDDNQFFTVKAAFR